MVISIQNLHLNDVEILKDIETVDKRNPRIIDRERHFFLIPYGLIRINAIDPDNDLVDIRSVHLDGLTIDLEESERAALMAPYRRQRQFPVPPLPFPASP